MNNYMVDENYNDGRIVDCSNCVCYRCKLSTRGQQNNMANCHNCENCKRHSHFKDECPDVFVEDNVQTEQQFIEQQVPTQQDQTPFVIIGLGIVLLIVNIVLLHIWWLYILAGLMILSMHSMLNRQQ